MIPISTPNKPMFCVVDIEEYPFSMNVLLCESFFSKIIQQPPTFYSLTEFEAFCTDCSLTSANMMIICGGDEQMNKFMVDHIEQTNLTPTYQFRTILDCWTDLARYVKPV